MFVAARRDVFVGGNIGRPLLGKLEEMTTSSWVVLELSSFQLEPLQVSPFVAVVTNLTPNHLDRHPSMEAYWAAKGQILAHQSPSDWAVLNADDPWTLRYRPRGRVLHFSLERFVDDSIATAPERSIAALQAYDEPLVLIAGGRDKHLPMHDWAALIARRVRHVVLLGEMSELVQEAIKDADPMYGAISRAATMD